MKGRVPGIVSIVVGVGLLIYVFAIGLFGVSSSFEALSEDLRPLATQQAIAQSRADLAGLEAVVNDFGANGLTILSNALNLTQAQAAQLFTSAFPNTATAVATLPGEIPTLRALLDQLDAQRANFASADAIPTSSQSSTTVPWTMVIWAVLAIGAGITMMLFHTRTAAIVIAVVAVTMVAGPLVLSLPEKARDADRLNEAFKPVFTAANVDAVSGTVTTVQAMATELSTSLVPTLAQALQVSDAQAQAFVATNFPTLAAALPQLEPGLARLQATSTFLQDNLQNFRTASATSIAPVPIVTIIAGFILFVVAAAGYPTAAQLAEEDRMAGSWRRRRRRAA